MEKKIEDVDKKVPNLNGVVTTTALTALKLQFPTLNYIYVKIKRKNIHVTLADYNKFMKNILDAKIKK